MIKTTGSRLGIGRRSAYLDWHEHTGGDERCSVPAATGRSCRSQHDGGAPMSSSKVQGPHWPRVVHTARTPGPCGVHPTLCQWIPTLAQFGWCQVSDGRAEALIELDPRPGAPCTPEPACSSTPRPGVSRFCSPVSTTLRSRPPGASTSA